jgi:hypothetical protein
MFIRALSAYDKGNLNCIENCAPYKQMDTTRKLVECGRI